MRRVLIAVVLLMAVAGSVAAQPRGAALQARDALTRGLVAQYEVALIRERRLADNRESQLIAEYETRIRDLRARMDRGEVAAQAQLREARAQYATYVAPIAARNGEARQLVEGYQAQLARDVAQASPEQIAALQRFADGDQQAGFDQYQAESARRAAARQHQVEAAARAAAQTARAADAADARQLASLGETMRLSGAKPLAEVVVLYEHAAELDPSVASPWLALVRLYRDAGRTENSRQAFEHGLAAQPTLIERAQLQTELGHTLVKMGRLSEARTAFESALEIADGMVRSDADDRTAQQTLAVNLNRVGSVLAMEGDLPRARESVARSVDIVRHLLLSDPDGARLLQPELASSLRTLGELQLAQRDLSGALASQSEAVTIGRTLVAPPSDWGYFRELSLGLEGLGDVQLAMGDLEGAHASYRESLGIRHGLGNTTNAQAWRDIGVGHEKLGDVQLAQGQLERASASYAEGLAIFRCLADRDPNNAEAQRDTWEAMWKLQRFPDSGVSWMGVVSMMDNLDRRALLTPADRERLEEARANAMLDQQAPVPARLAGEDAYQTLVRRQFCRAP